MKPILGAALAAILFVAPLSAQTAPADPFLAANARKHGVRHTASGLQYRVIKPGKGASPSGDDVAMVKYVGRFTNGKQFDASATPVPLPLNKVVKGFSEGLKLMRKGAVYRLWLPAPLAYGAKDVRDDDGSIAIPANSTLVFDVTLVDFTTRAAFDAAKAGATAPSE